MRPSRVSAAGQIEWTELSPKGERALFVARGDVFTLPSRKARRAISPTHRTLTTSSRSGRRTAQRSRSSPTWMAKTNFTSSTRTGSGKPEELTHGFHAMLYQPSWAPDGKRIAFSDKDGKLYVLTLEDKKVTQIAQNPRGRIRSIRGRRTAAIWRSPWMNRAGSPAFICGAWLTGRCIASPIRCTTRASQRGIRRATISITSARANTSRS